MWQIFDGKTSDVSVRSNNKIIKTYIQGVLHVQSCVDIADNFLKTKNQKRKRKKEERRMVAQIFHFQMLVWYLATALVHLSPCLLNIQTRFYDL